MSRDERADPTHPGPQSALPTRPAAAIAPPRRPNSKAKGNQRPKILQKSPEEGKWSPKSAQKTQRELHTFVTLLTSACRHERRWVIGGKGSLRQEASSWLAGPSANVYMWRHSATAGPRLGRFLRDCGDLISFIRFSLYLKYYLCF